MLYWALEEEEEAIIVHEKNTYKLRKIENKMITKWLPNVWQAIAALQN